MNCHECGKRPATLHFTKIINGDKTEFHFCDVCAKEKGELIPGSPGGFSIHNLLSGLLDFEPGGGSSGAKTAKTLRCEECGLTYAQFGKLGRFGCSRCYEYFNDRLDPLLRRVHGNTVHIGKVPGRTSGKLTYKKEIEKLKRELQSKIEQEEFEQAAMVRDQIRELEKKIAETG